MSDYSAKLPPYTILVALKDIHGAEKTICGFAEVSGLPRRLQGLHKTTDVTLKRGSVSSKALLDWMGTSHSGWRPIRQEVFLIQRNENGTRVGSWQLVSTYPVKYEGPTLGGQANDVAIEELVLSSEGIEWRPPK